MKLKRTTALSTVAIVALSTGALASGDMVEMQPAGTWMADELIGSSVYRDVTPDAETIGDINSLVIGQDGTVSAVVVGVGGFLGMGEKNVAAEFDDLIKVVVEGEQRFVLQHTREALEAAPAFKTDDGETYSISAMWADESSKPSSDNLRTLTIDELSTDRFVGARVYTMDDEWIGEIGEVVFTSDGQVDAVVIDFGGWLGSGEKPVAVGLEALTFKSDGDTDGDYYVYTELSNEQLEAAPAYDAEGYQQERESMRIANK